MLAKNVLKEEMKEYNDDQEVDGRDEDWEKVNNNRGREKEVEF
jgi:hypothetical protein